MNGAGPRAAGSAMRARSPAGTRGSRELAARGQWQNRLSRVPDSHSRRTPSFTVWALQTRGEHRGHESEGECGTDETEHGGTSCEVGSRDDEGSRYRDALAARPARHGAESA